MPPKLADRVEVGLSESPEAALSQAVEGSFPLLKR